jgi:RPA family protein
MMAREPAWRIFAFEFNDSMFVPKTGQEKETNYILTRMGAKVNRVLISGIIENKNIINENTFITGIVNDRTGTFHISADKNYSPLKVWSYLFSIEPPVRVLLVGKVRSYGESKNLDIRVENITECDSFIEDYWRLSAAINLVERIKIMKLALSEEKDKLLNMGYSEESLNSIFAAIENFKDTKIDAYLKTIREMFGISQEEKNPEDVILQLIESLDFDGKGARYEDVVENALKEGFERTRVDEIIDSLLERGLIYEPSVNIFKKL